jgi:hypothetical protein
VFYLSILFYSIPLSLPSCNVVLFILFGDGLLHCVVNFGGEREKIEEGGDGLGGCMDGWNESR